MNEVFITGMGSYLPRLSHTNATLPPLDKPLKEGDLARIGVTQRGWASEDETIPEMARRASVQALERAGLAAQELDLVILANWTQRRFIPEFAPKLQALLGTKAFAFDVCCACAGFAVGVATAHGFLQTPRYWKALVVAAETTSKRGRPHSKSTLIFGDAAGAWVLEKGVQRGATLIDYELETDGSKHDAMEVNAEGHVVTHIPQKELNALAAKSFAEPAQRLLARQKLDLRDVDWIVPHAGTAGIQALLLEVLSVPADKVLTNFALVGNTSSAAIPVALDAFVREGRIKKGDLVLSPTTGTGWYAAALLYRV